MLWKILWEGFIQREPVRELERCDQEVQVLHSGMASLNSSVACGEWDCGVLLCIVQVGNARQGIWGHRSTSDALRGR